MQINNPVQMNDWEIKKFLKVVLAIHLALWGAIGLNAIGLEIPIIRQLIGFIYLTFIPGIIILRILKLHKLGNIETILYTVGLSLATLMFTGLFMNAVYPIFGISGPISTSPLLITISMLVLALCILSYVRDKDFSDPSIVDVGNTLSPPALFLCLIPFLSFFGRYLMNFHDNNIILMFLIVILALIVILIAFDKFIPKNLYPLAVFVIAISLLYNNSLISMYLWGCDIQYEYYFSNLVTIAAQWDSTIPAAINAMSSIIMLAPIFSNITDMSLTWVFKISYPLLFSLVPLGLYRVFQKQTDDKIAFLSCFFFVSLDVFYVEMVSLARQEIAELFLVLLILLMIDKNMVKTKRSFLFILFGISLAVSHYGLSYIYMFCLIAAWLMLVSGEFLGRQKLKNNFYSKFGRKREKTAENPNSPKVDRTISSTFVLLFITFTLTWYMYVSSSFTFDTIVRIGDHISSSIFTDFLNPEAAQGWSILMSETASPLHRVFKYIHLLFQFFILVGVLELFLKRKEMNFEDEYTAFSLVNVVICFGGIALPYFASSFNTTRLYQITLIFLAPFCVIGSIMFFRILSKIVRVSWTDQHVKSSLKVLSVLLAIFLLFNTGLVYEVTKDHPTSIALNNTIDFPRFNDQEVLGAKWWYSVKDNDPTYADGCRYFLLLSSDPKVIRPIPANVDQIAQDSYLYLGTRNVVEGEVVRLYRKGVRSTREFINLSDIVDGRSKIYDNGCNIYK